MKKKSFSTDPVQDMYAYLYVVFSSLKANISWFLDVTLDHVQRSQLFSLSLCFPHSPHFAK